MVCGIGSGNIPKPGDPDNNSVFTATGTYGGITLKWTLPLTNAHAVAHYHIYRATANNVNQANRIATLNADTYFNAIPNNALNATYYYWLEVVTVNGTILPKIGPVEARALPEVERYLELLSNQIDQGLLSQSLNEKIAKLEGLEDGIHRQEQYIKNETGALATALESVQVSLGDVSATVADVVKTQVSENEALAERISTAQAKLGDDIASTQVQMQSHITKTEDGLEKLGSLYTVKVDVNGLVGGFGVYNDGTTVEAGFNVDKFWVGRAGTKIKPFIIQDNTVYMNSAVIKDITFDKLKDATGQFVVQGGKIKAKYLEIPLITADMIDTRNLTIKDANGNVIFGAGQNIDVNRVSGLGTLAKQNTVGTNQVTGLGSLATKNNVNVAEVMGLGAFAKISKLDVNNINTYIGGAAIGEALIGNAAIKTAHIKELSVDTLRLKNNAVTEVMHYTFGPIYASSLRTRNSNVRWIHTYTFSGSQVNTVLFFRFRVFTSNVSESHETTGVIFRILGTSIGKSINDPNVNSGSLANSGVFTDPKLVNFSNESSDIRSRDFSKFQPSVFKNMDNFSQGFFMSPSNPVTIKIGIIEANPRKYNDSLYWNGEFDVCLFKK